MNAPSRTLRRADQAADLRQVIYALSDALDLVGVDDVGHGKRLGIMARECGRCLDASDIECGLLFDLGLLHDIGISSTRMHRNVIDEFDWAGSQDHAATGHDLLAGFKPLDWMALPVRYHHTRWDALPLDKLTPLDARRANLIHLLDRVDALMAPSQHNALGMLRSRAGVRECIARHAGSYFDPDLVAAFLETSRTEAFWLLLEPRAIHYYLQDMREQAEPWLTDMVELRRLATIFSRIVDAKSPFTATHSLGVSRLSRYLAEQMGVAPANCDKLEIAGLLHDLGKLRVPDEILDKPASLSDDERLIINAHSFETYQILHDLDGFADIARWAAYHHEEPDGSGYPFHIVAELMPLEARILRVADIFQAMAQDRPYRPGLNAKALADFMWTLVAANRIDGDVVGAALADIEQSMRAALP